MPATPSMSTTFILVPARVLAVLALCGAAAACGSRTAAGPPPQAAVPVGVQKVEAHPVERTSEYVATIRSRRSSEVRPQVDGVITKIYVRSGDRVRAGAPLVQIDPARQQATLTSVIATRTSQEAALQYAEQEYERQKKLFDAGLVSKQMLEQAATTVDTTRASVNALKAQEQEARVQLQYYRVSAETEGTVGDIPVRVGDRVTTDTVLTTIVQNAGLEAYIYVPIERSADLRDGLPVRIVDNRGTVLDETKIYFVSPQVDDRTQAVLAKAPVHAKTFRNEQFVRARIVWSAEPALTVPVLSVARINGQYFGYVAEQSDKGLVARQRPLQLGEVVGNDYVVLRGLEPGERVIVSGIQKLADGVPVKASEGAALDRPAAVAGWLSPVAGSVPRA
jgi:RND family efflux transporter MFP subunit